MAARLPLRFALRLAPLRQLVRALLLAALLAGLVAAPGGLVPARAEDTPPPETVTIPGTIQSKLGCPGDWQPACAATFLAYDAEDDVWQAAFDLPAGDYEYKVAINQTWEENYGLNATSYGPNIPLALPAAANVKFYYDHKNHWVTDSANTVIATVTGSFQSELGCVQDWDAGCLRSWLQDPDGDGGYGFLTTAIPPGDYEAAVALGEQDGQTDGPTVGFSVTEAGAEVYFGYSPERHSLFVSTEGAPRGNIAAAQAHWVRRDLILWNVPGVGSYRYFLHADPNGALTLEPGAIRGGTEFELRFERGGPGDEVFQQFPHLAGFSTFRLAEADLARVPELLRGQLAVSARDASGKLIDASGLQIPGALDDLYHYDGPLGVSWENGAPVLRLWAPTAQRVTLWLYADARAAEPAERLALTRDEASGVWRIPGQPGWNLQYYLYEVQVYVPSTGQVERNLVTDPYSLSLATNSRRSQIVDLNDPALAPPGWTARARPPLAAPEDIVLYELHVRDFSASDPGVRPEVRGKYLAFSEPESAGMAHLRRLAAAGLTHVHLLPAFDIASVEEDPAARVEPDPQALAALPPDSEQQQALIGPLKDRDAFNWGYDPYHYSVAEGSYATDADGPARIREFRAMVQALNAAGLRVVLDVVYNHTTASGQGEKSVLDRIVPGYYHRLSASGAVETSTCCANTASEHAMMRKLMIDSLRLWATAYGIDGFRFDLMGHHLAADVAAARDALRALTLARDGVDGQALYLYGEGWDFGEVAGNARGVNASQLNLTGLGVGSFNDRIRDALRGGHPFGEPWEQGFATGLVDAPNGREQGTPEEQRARLLAYADHIRLGLAGNLRAYTLVNARGEAVAGEKIYYGAVAAAYTADPQENIVYASAHDNETLFDAIQLKAPEGLPLAERVRMNNLAISVIALSQGVPFFHAGDELLRSKSLDRNSYNSGDWFNRLDFTYRSNNWGVGLPPAEGNQDHWPLMAPLLARRELAPGEAEIRAALAHFETMLRIRRSSPLFRLRTADDIITRVTFANTGPEQLPGVIVMILDDTGGADLDPAARRIVVVFNSRAEEAALAVEALRDAELALHPLLAESADPLVRGAAFDPATGTLRVPGRTTAVFLAAQPAGTPWLPLAALAVLGVGLLLSVLVLSARREKRRREGT
jgi:pullulanase-type alpha-1,6-glucosidase